MFMPVKTDKPTNVFGAYGDELKKLLPSESVPEEFYSGHNPWSMIVAKWFFEGLPKGTLFIAKEGIHGEDVYKHVSSIMRSWEPKHEDKEAICAYLLSLWLERIDFPAPSKKPRDYSMDAAPGFVEVKGKGADDEPKH